MLKEGNCYLFHTHLGIWLGRVAGMDGDDVCLNECAWIPDQGRMSVCVATGDLVKVELVGDGILVPRTAIKVPWRHALPTASK